jgi:SAM-dependent methyltransferase
MHRLEFEALKAGRKPPNFVRRRILNQIEKLIPGRRMIEIGGGTGSFGMLAKARGWKYRNFDISPAAVGFCRELGLDAQVLQSGETPRLLPLSADLIVMWEVIEHLWDVHEYLAVVRKALSGGGIFVLSTPNYKTPALFRRDSWGICSSPPVHLSFFDRGSLLKTLQSAGFDRVEIRRWRLYRPYGGLRGWATTLKFALMLAEPPTLYALSRAKHRASQPA